MHNSFDLLLIELKALVADAEFDAALYLLKRWLDGLAVDHRLHGRVFSSPELDQVCLEIGAQVLSAQTSIDKINSIPHGSVFVTSELYVTGGHTKLIRDYIIALAQPHTTLIVTDPANNTDRPKITKLFADLPVTVLFSPEYISLLDKLQWLMRALASINASECYLLNHANDPVAISGMQKELVPKIKFVHHCDHTLTLGMHLPHFAHLDYRPQGFENCHRLGIQKNILVPLVAPDLGCAQPEKRFLTNGALHTCTSGGYKFEIPYAYDLASLLPNWLKATRGVHTHIGLLADNTIQAIRYNLNKLGIAQDRFRLITYSKNLWTSLIDLNVDLYIDSFPVCGARSTVEAMGAGIPCAIHHNYAHAIWSNVDFAYPQAFVWHEPQQLEQFLSRVDKETLTQLSNFARSFYLKYHHPNLLNHALKYNNFRPNDEKEPAYKINALRTFFDQFAPISSRPAQQRETLVQFLTFLKVQSLHDNASISFLEDYLSPGDFYHFQELLVEIRATCQAVDSLNSVHNILNEDGKINCEKFTKLLYRITAHDSSATEFRTVISPKFRAKLFYQRIKYKYGDLVQKN